MITDPVFYALAVPAVVALGLSKGGFAGAGQIATPLLALLMPPLDAAALLLPIMITQDALSVWIYRRDFDRRNLKIMVPGALVGIGSAWLLAVHVSDATILLGVGIISAAFVVHAWLAERPDVNKTPKVAPGVFWGGLSGFTSTLIQAGSPPYQVYVLPQQLPKLTFVGTTAIFFATINAVKVVPYFALGHFSPRNFATSVALLPLAVLTNFLGVWLVTRISTILFYRLAHILVFVISLELIREGALILWRG